MQKVICVLVLAAWFRTSACTASSSRTLLRDYAVGAIGEGHWASKEQSQLFERMFPGELMTRPNGSRSDQRGIWIQPVRSDTVAGIRFLRTGVAVAYTADGWGVLVLYAQKSDDESPVEYWRSDKVRGSTCNCNVLDMDGDGTYELAVEWVTHGATWFYPNIFIYSMSPSAIQRVSPLGAVAGFSLLSGRDYSVHEEGKHLEIEIVREGAALSGTSDSSGISFSKVRFQYTGGTATVDSVSVRMEHR